METPENIEKSIVKDKVVSTKGEFFCFKDSEFANQSGDSTNKDSLHYNEDNTDKILSYSDDLLNKDIFEDINDMDIEAINNFKFVENEEDNEDIEEQIFKQDEDLKEVERKYSKNIEKMKKHKLNSTTVLSHHSYKLDNDVTRIEEEIRFEENNNGDFILDESEKFYYNKKKFEPNTIQNKFHTGKLLGINSLERRLNQIENEKKNETKNDLRKSVKFSVKKIIFEYPEDNLPELILSDKKFEIKKKGDKKVKKNKKVFDDDELSEEELRRLEEVRKRREDAKQAKEIEKLEEEKRKKAIIEIEEKKSQNSGGSKGKKKNKKK